MFKHNSVYPVALISNSYLLPHLLWLVITCKNTWQVFTQTSFTFL